MGMPLITWGILTLIVFESGAKAQQPLFSKAPGSFFESGRQPEHIVIGDVNGDGHLDVLTANNGSNDLSVLLGDGQGGFSPLPGSPFPAGQAPHLLVVGDVNGDGNLDAVLTSHDSNSITVLLGNGRGHFSEATGSPFVVVKRVRAHNHGLALADFNADGNPDVATSNHAAGSVSVLLGDGHGGFNSAEGSPFTVGEGPYPLAVGDVNQDGRLDIVTPNLNGNSVTVLLGNGKGNFLPARGSPYPVPPRPYFVALGDLDSDGRLDLVTTHDETSTITVLMSNEKGEFSSASGPPIDTGRRGWKLTINDVNSDGWADLVMGTTGDAVTVLLGDGTRAFMAAPGSPFAVGRGPWSVAVADLNHDNKPDIVTANSESHDVSVLLGQ